MKKHIIGVAAISVALMLGSCGGSSLEKDAKNLGEMYCEMVKLQEKADAASGEELEKIEKEIKEIDEKGEKLGKEYKEKYGDKKDEFKKVYQETVEKCK
ncbi:MAG: hypothetical protein KKA07_04015 [Bacteroidetes bacterium]|nr:hypothetical protein [Bacteroidota bacterium]MBU1718217.1 hypothetical protein [Bacteroidota bacterium]